MVFVTYNMSRPTILFVFFLIQFLSQSLGLWDVVITRDGQDSFRLVDKNDLSCYRTNNEYCTMKNGKLDSNAKTCQCVCPSNASTFAFVTGNWRCINDIRRKSSKCTLLLIFILILIVTYVRLLTNNWKIYSCLQFILHKFTVHFNFYGYNFDF